MGMWRIALAFLGIAAVVGVAPASAASPLRPINDTADWQIRKTYWSQADEDGYAAFVQLIGRSDCSSLEDCLKSAANPLRSSVDPRLTGDCADMAYILRGYYAWKMGLPFSYQSAMRTADGAAEDIRYSTAGNVVVSRRSAVGAEPINARAYLARIGGEVSTAMFRTHPETGGGRTHDDFYPVEISRAGVRPGVIAYDIFGHVGIVYDVLEDGRILVVASHPDNSVTRTVYGPNFMRSGPHLGAGLKAWRPVWIEGAQEGADGVFRGGRLKGAQNAGLEHYSLEQYFGNAPHPSGDWAAGQFRHGERTLEYYDFVRRRMAAPDFAYNPVDELRYGLQSICGSIKARKVAVDKAYSSRIYLKPHPNRLPPNIFGTYGEWEEYSTPSRDARLKISFIELRRELEKLVNDLDAGAPSVRYEGDDLAGDLLAAFDEEKSACTFTYKRSDSTRVLMHLGHVADRLFDLSFDPYHCPERRWGARGAELETCADNELKSQWYNAQRFLRYQAERTYDVRMDFTLSELKPPMMARPEQGGLGVEAPADADIRGFIQTLLGAEDMDGSSPSTVRVRFSTGEEV